MSPHHPNHSVQDCLLKIKEVTSRDAGKAKTIKELQYLQNNGESNYNNSAQLEYNVRVEFEFSLVWLILGCIPKIGFVTCLEVP